MHQRASLQRVLRDLPHATLLMRQEPLLDARRQLDTEGELRLQLLADRATTGAADEARRAVLDALDGEVLAKTREVEPEAERRAAAWFEDDPRGTTARNVGWRTFPSSCC